MRFRKLILALVACVASFGAKAGEFPRQEVDVVLVLLIDASFTIKDDEFELQRRGYAAAFRSPEVIGAIKSGLTGAIGVIAVRWSGFNEQRRATEWHMIDSEASSYAFATELDRMDRLYRGRTYVGQAVRRGVEVIESAPFTGLRLVLDISGDGTDWNGAADSEAARDWAVGRGIIINGLPIQSLESGVVSFYRDSVCGGPGSFIVPANGYADFPEAVRKKLVLEIAGLVP